MHVHVLVRTSVVVFFHLLLYSVKLMLLLMSAFSLMLSIDLFLSSNRFFGRSLLVALMAAAAAAVS